MMWPKIVSLPIPKNKYDLKCPYLMDDPDSVTVHNTWNSVSAMAEASFSAGNDWETSSHAYADEIQIVLSVPSNRNAWHAGDGARGRGNRNSYCVEICRSRSDLALFKKAEINGAKYVAMILHEKGWGIDRVVTHQHWSGKYCPHRTLDLGWARFLKMVAEYLAILKKEDNEDMEDEKKPKFGVFALNPADYPAIDEIVSNIPGAVKFDWTKTPTEMFETIIQIGGKKQRDAYEHIAGKNRGETLQKVREWIRRNKE